MPIKQLSHLGEITFAAGARVSFDIPRWDPLLALMLRLQFTITNGGSNAVGPKFQTLARLIRKAEVVLMGRETIWNVDGPTLALQAFKDTGLGAEGMDAAVVLTSGAATTYTVYLPMYFNLPARYAFRPDDTGIDFRTGIEASLLLEFASADCSDFYITPNGAALSNVNIEVSGLYERAPLAGRSYFNRTLDMVITDLPASNTALQVTLDKGSSIMYRSIGIHTVSDDVLVNTILGNRMIEFGVGNQPIDKVKAEHLRSTLRADLGIAPPAGVYHLDKSWFGQGITYVPTQGLPTDLVLKLDAVKQGTVSKIIAVREGFRPGVVK